MNNKKSLTVAFVACALVFVIFGYVILQTAPKQQALDAPKYQMVVAKNNITKDSLIKEEDVEIKDFPMNVEGSYKATGEVVGRGAKMDINSGKPIMKSFIKEIVMPDYKPNGEEPSSGFRAVPALLKTTLLPPYVATGAIVDLVNQENTLRIDNLRILNVLNTSKDSKNKILVFEIKNSDVSAFVNILTETKGLVLIQKNKGEYGDYRFTNSLTPPVFAKPAPVVSKIPPIEDIPKIGEIDSPLPPSAANPSFKKEVEVIVGNQKSKVEFE